MADNVTITPEELQKLQSFQVRYRAATSQFGELHFQKKLVEAELDAIDEEMSNIETERVAFVNELQAKYGAGTVNINTGDFLPAPESVTPSNPSA